MVIAASSNPKKIDESLKRAGRFDKIISIDIPKAQDRLKILNLYLSKAKHDLSEQDIKDINF